MKKLISLLLALMLVCSLIPMTTFAAFNPADYQVIVPDGDKWIGYKPGDKLGEDGTDVTDDFNKFLADQEKAAAKNAPIVHDPNEHEFGYDSNTKYHWLQCVCGCQISMEPHVDPKDAENDYCFCGYHFSDNADLVTLWIDGCPPIKGFNKNKTEYKLNAYTYKDVKEIKIATTTFDSEATVELPEDLTLKEGENKFEVKVTAENQKVTKVYTVIINKEAKK